jgi:hypothetical protein
MSEENTELQPTEVVPEASESTEAPKLSAIEQKALEMGWRPREEFDGDDETFIDAKEFVNRAPLFEKISSQSKQIKRLEQAQHALQGHYNKVRQTEYNAALRALKAELEVAVEEGDLTKYHALNEKREEIEQDHQTLKQELAGAQVEPEVPAELEQWIERNSWFKTQPHMRVFADNASDRFAAKVRAGLMTTGEALREVEKLVREEFPGKFRNPNKDKPSAVEGGAGKGGGRASGEIELSADEKRIMNTVLNTKDRDGKPFITREKYLADLKKMRGQ